MLSSGFGGKMLVAVAWNEARKEETVFSSRPWHLADGLAFGLGGEQRHGEQRRRRR